MFKEMIQDWLGIETSEAEVKKIINEILNDTFEEAWQQGLEKEDNPNEKVILK